MVFALLHAFMIIGIANYNARNNGGLSSAAVSGYQFTCDCTSVSSSVCTALSCSMSLSRSSCFAGMSVVKLLNGETKELSELKINDYVLVDESGVYEPVTSFIHAQHEGIYNFLEMKIQSTVSNLSSSLYVSSNHLIFDYDTNTAIHASDFRVGQRVAFIDQDHMVPGEILDIQTTHRKGFFAPLTPSGKMVINGVLASNYASVRNHDLAHQVMNIYRWYLNVTHSESEWNEKIPATLEYLSVIARPIEWIHSLLNRNSIK